MLLITYKVLNYIVGCPISHDFCLSSKTGKNRWILDPFNQIMPSIYCASCSAVWYPWEICLPPAPMFFSDSLKTWLFPGLEVGCLWSPVGDVFVRKNRFVWMHKIFFCCFFLFSFLFLLDKNCWWLLNLIINE